jgi:hypothetical protein
MRKMQWSRPYPEPLNPGQVFFFSFHPVIYKFVLLDQIYLKGSVEIDEPTGIAEYPRRIYNKEWPDTKIRPNHKNRETWWPPNPHKLLLPIHTRYCSQSTQGIAPNPHKFL